MIDWTQPVETNEIPPRLVRVLATDFKVKGFPYLCAVDYGNYEAHALFSAEGWDTQRMMCLRNVPAKPVRHERWVCLYADGTMGIDRHTREECEGNARKSYLLAEIRHIVWNSDGSPVEDDEAAKLLRDAFQWKAKAEALQAEVNELSRAADIERADVEKWHRRTLAQKPVVNAAVSMADGDADVASVIKAVREYQSKQPAKGESHEAMALADAEGCDRDTIHDEVREAVRNLPLHEVARRHSALRWRALWDQWEPKP